MQSLGRRRRRGAGVVVLLAALGLTACAPTVRYVKPGVAPEQAAADFAVCRSARDDIYYEQIRRIEDYYRNQAMTLRHVGTILDQPGYGRAQDAAAARATARCMDSKGYQMVSGG